MGEIVDFSKPNRRQPIKILGAKAPIDDPQLVDVSKQVQRQPFEVHRHEEVVVVRQRKSDGKLDLRFRAAKNRKLWEDAKNEGDK